MEINAEKPAMMTNSVNRLWREIKVKGQRLGTLTSFKCLGAVASDEGSKPDVLSRIALATAAVTKPKPAWRDNNTSLGSKDETDALPCYFHILVNLTVELEKRTQAFKMRCHRKLLNILYK